MTEQKTLATHGGCCPTCGYEMSAYQWSNHQSCPKCATPSLPDTQERYPSEAEQHEWFLRYGRDRKGEPGKPEEPIFAYMVRKACDWQREQDAQLCNVVADTTHDPVSSLVRALGQAIHTPPQPGAAQ